VRLSLCPSVCPSVSVCVCLSARISPEPHARSLPIFKIHVAMSLAPSVLLRHVDDRPHRLSAGRGDGSAQRGRIVIYDCLVMLVMTSTVK